MRLSKEKRDTMRKKIASGFSVASTVDMEFMLGDLEDKDKEIAELDDKCDKMLTKLAEKEMEISRWGTQYNRALQRANTIILEKDKERELAVKLAVIATDKLHAAGLRAKDKEIEELKADVVALQNSLKPCDRSDCDNLRHPQFRFCEKHTTLPGQYKGGTC